MTAVEEVSPDPPHRIPRPWSTQRWRDATFLHWPYDPAVVAPLLPPGTRPDVLDGDTYVGIIAFRMVGLGLGRGPGIPYFGTFCETNVRLYSVDERGRRAVVFRSLDAARLASVVAARAALGLPYVWSRMRIDRHGDVISYRSARHVTGAAPLRLSVRVGEDIAEPSAADQFVTARWALHTRAWGRTRYVANEHPRWPLRSATVLQLDERLVTAAGLPPPEGLPSSILFSPGVRVAFGTPALP
ncbi:DUF2071 domain-containing protein [Microbacterium sp. BK668]|uniref:YqjF family protein n=1 Tax=Microbacterium sp. BK668 TaxID=2512118 RepID=UPI0010DDAC83|nr:DUF2071 domain-containing protein [Microbacterium sp. BK668]TDN91317.1 hypothetical protein EV279_0816 [Microbacterium sp. BK668]